MNRSNDGGDGFAALDFGDETGYDSGMADLDFGDESGHQSGNQWATDAVPTDDAAEAAASAATEASVVGELLEDTGEVKDTATEEDEFSWERTTVTNPPETVSVTALMDGKTLNVELAPGAASMTESELAAEILVIADLATQRASSVLHTLLTDSMKAQGHEVGASMADAMGGVLALTPAKQAEEAQAEVFATRYSNQTTR
jgi:hypothetical protein